MDELRAGKKDINRLMTHHKRMNRALRNVITDLRVVRGMLDPGPERELVEHCIAFLEMTLEQPAPDPALLIRQWRP